MHQRRLYPSISALRAFDALVRHGSFTAAARDLSLTQGAISRQVAALEAQLGVELVRREGRRFALSAAGAAYAPRARSALESLGRGAMEALGQGPENGFRLAILPTFGTRWLMPRIPGFVRSHPQITLSFVTRIGQCDFAAEGIDAAIHSGRADWPGARHTLLMQERVMPVAAPGLFGAGLHEGAPLLALASRPQAWTEWRAATGRPGAAAPPLMSFEQVATLAQAAAAGMGAALMPGFLIRPELESGALVPLGPEVASGAGYYFVEPEASPQGQQKRERPADLFREWILTQIDRDTVV